MRHTFPSRTARRIAHDWRHGVSVKETPAERLAREYEERVRNMTPAERRAEEVSRTGMRGVRDRCFRWCFC